jgi:hypothetical protein
MAAQKRSALADAIHVPAKTASRLAMRDRPTRTNVARVVSAASIQNVRVTMIVASSTPRGPATMPKKRIVHEVTARASMIRPALAIRLARPHVPLTRPIRPAAPAMTPTKKNTFCAIQGSGCAAMRAARSAGSPVACTADSQGANAIAPTSQQTPLTMRSTAGFGFIRRSIYDIRVQPVRRGSLAAVLLVLVVAGCAHTGGWVSDRLYCGRSVPGGGMVSDVEWALFMSEVVTPRFPDGLTVWRAEGQWREGETIVHEPSMVIEILNHGEPAAVASIEAIAREYRKRFRQTAVLRVTVPARATFIND